MPAFRPSSIAPAEPGSLTPLSPNIAGKAVDGGPKWYGRPGFIVGSILFLAVAASFAAWFLTRPTWDPRLEPYVEFVEQARGYEFDGPVDVQQLDISEALAADWEGQQQDYGEEAWADYWNPWTEAYRLLGLYDPEVSLDQATNDATIANAAAYYDPDRRAIMLPAGEIDIVMAETIVHELTHALQHEHGMLNYPFESEDGSYMRSALIEGDANRIAQQWLASRTEAEIEEYWSIIDARIYPDAPDDFLTASFYSPYGLGEPVVEVLIRTEGVEALDALLRSKSLGSSERLFDVLSPSPSPTSDASISLRLPNGEQHADGDLGPVVWYQALAPHVGVETALDAMIGYNDDAFVAYVAGDDSTCVRHNVLFDSSEDAGEFAGALVRFGAAPDAIDERATSVQVDICEPLGDPALQNTGVLLPVVWANWLAENHLRNGLTIEQSRCASLSQAETIPLVVDPDTDWLAVLAESENHVRDCL